MMFGSKPVKIIMLVIVLMIGVFILIQIVEKVDELKKFPEVNTINSMTDPWNYTTTHKKDIPIYSKEEFEELLEPVLKDEL